MDIQDCLTSYSATSWPSSARRTDLERLLRLGAVLLAPVAAVYIGRAVITAPEQTLFLPFLPLAPLILRNPVIGLYLLIPVGLLVPYWVRVPLPLFDSPLEVAAIFTTVATMAYWARRRTAWPRTSLYWPLLACIVILGLGALLRHGLLAGSRLYFFAEGLLPFFLTVLLIDSPRKARILLLSIFVPLLLRTLAVWPIALFYGGESGLVFRQTQIVDDWLYWLWGFREGTLALTLSLLAPPIFALVALARRWRLRLALLALIVTGALLLTTYRAGLLNLVLTGIVVSALVPGRLRRRVVVAALLTGMLSLSIGMLGFYTPGVQALLDNWQSTVVALRAQDSIWIDRLWALRYAFEVFKRSPWTGVGAMTSGSIPGVELRGQLVPLYGHTSIGKIAYEYGITLLLAWSAVFLVTGRMLFRLYRTVRYGLDRALVIGLLGTWVIMLVQALINNTLFLPTLMQIFWACMGLAVVWDEWLRRDPGARLVDWEW